MADWKEDVGWTPMCPHCERPLAGGIGLGVMGGDTRGCAAHIAGNFRQDCDAHTIQLLRCKVAALEAELLKKSTPP